MAGKIRLFEKLDDGRLCEVAEADADARRAAGMVSHVFIGIDVLWTAEEIAARRAEEEAALAAESQRRAALAEAAEARAQRRAEIAGRLGLTCAELDEITDEGT